MLCIQNGRKNQLSCCKKPALEFCCRGTQKICSWIWPPEDQKKHFQTYISCRSLTMVPTWIIITNFWLSVFQRTLWPVKWFPKNWRANWIPSSSLQVEDLQHSSMDQFRWQTRLQSWTKLLGHFCIFGSFSNPHRSNPSPHPTNDVGCVYVLSQFVIIIALCNTCRNL